MFFPKNLFWFQISEPIICVKDEVTDNFDEIEAPYYT